MNPKRITTIFIRQMFLLRRSPIRLLALFYWSTLELFLWGVLTVYLNRIGGDQFNFLTFILGAVVLSSFLIRVIHGITISFLEDVWARNLINIFASPLSVHEYILGLVLTAKFEKAVSISFMAVLAWILFSYSIFHFGFMLIPFMGVLFIFGWAIGIFATAAVLRLGPSAEMLTWSIPALIPPLSAVFYPVSALPTILQTVSNFIPSTYVFEGMRAAMRAGSFDTSQFILAMLLAFAYLIVAYIFLFASYRAVLKRGLFTRFLTE